MRPLLLEFQAFGPYTGHEVIDFEKLSSKGLFLICGETGSGKTMLLDAMSFALFGKSSGAVRDSFEAMRSTAADFETATFVKLIIEAGGEYYHFERRLERKKKNLSASYSLMKKDDDGIYKPLLENPKEKDLNKMAEQLIGLDYDQFRQVIILPQGQFEKLLTSNSDEKEKILSNIFGEDKWQKIADKMFEEASIRRDALKNKKEKISNSLLEENCENIDALRTLISSKVSAAENIDNNIASLDYEKKQEELQNKLSLIKSFNELDKVNSEINDLESKRLSRNAYELKLKEARQANKVKKYVDELDKATKEKINRSLDVEAAQKSILIAEEKEKEINNSLLEHINKSTEFEEKRKLLNTYENKKTDYVNIGAAKAEYENALDDVSAAASALENSKKEYEKITNSILLFQKDYDELNGLHKTMLDSYLNGITGEIASSLIENKPCPVCGSTSHPSPAKIMDNHVTKDAVDKKKEEADSAYQSLQNELAKQENAKQKVDEKTSALSNNNTKLASAKTKYESLADNLIENIKSLAELENAIKDIENQLEEYETQKTALENAQKSARDVSVKAKTKIEAANKELELAFANLKDANDKLEIAIKENGFSNLDEIRAHIMSEDDMANLQETISKFDADVEAAKKRVLQLETELKDIERPDENECRVMLTELNSSLQTMLKEKSVLEAEIKRLKYKLNTLENEGDGIEEAIREAEEDWSFAKKLRGDSGTGLQRYVLGIMFSSVIAAANKMLELVHGGRYRLFRSDDKAQGTNKRGLELKVIDKYSDNPEGRFVSTLSGGEKFLASLALSIGMSTIAQKSGIKIEALFIDEGFGSLDEDSIDDAMNILSSIKEANGLVGIISHVQILQDQIPTKLMIEKKEGRSHIFEEIG